MCRGGWWSIVCGMGVLAVASVVFRFFVCGLFVFAFSLICVGLFNVLCG